MGKSRDETSEITRAERESTVIFQNAKQKKNTQKTHEIFDKKNKGRNPEISKKKNRKSVDKIRSTPKKHIHKFSTRQLEGL